MKSRNRKGMFILSFLTSLCLMLAIGVQAEESPVFAPLIEKDTTMIARIDVSKVDFGALTKKVSEVANPFIDAVVKTKEERDRTKMSIPLLISMFSGQYAAIVESLKQANVKDLYLVGNGTGDEMSNVYIAVEAQNRDKTQLKRIREAFGSFKELDVNIRFPFVRHGFVIAPYISPDQDNDDTIKAYIKKRFMKLNPVSDPGFAKGFEGMDGQTLTIVTIPSEEEKEQAVAGLADLKYNPMFQQGGDVAKKSLDIGGKFMEKAVKSIASTTYAFEPSNLSYTIRLRMKSAPDAENLKKDFVQLTGDTAKQVDDKTLVEGTKKFIDSLAPVIKGDTLQWKIDPDFLTTNRDFFIKLIEKAQKASEEQSSTDKKPASDKAAVPAK